MKEQDLRDMANKVAREFQTESDFEAFTKARSKQFRECGFEGELDDHLNYEKHETRGNGQWQDLKSSLPGPKISSAINPTACQPAYPAYCSD